ncbi:MAG: M23 family metallopeptidase [Bacteroidetes bacterium]|nr:M23 family metallopeptidase [Bacteroidota bacterium]
MAKETGKRKWRDRLRRPYRLVVMNDDTFAEQFSLRLTPMGILVLIGVVTIIMTTLVIMLIAFTPLREYIPGYSDPELRNELDMTRQRVDSLNRAAEANSIWVSNLQKILTGTDKPEKPGNPRDTSRTRNIPAAKPSAADTALRREIEGDMNTYSLRLGVKKSSGISGFFFFAPVKGAVTTAYSAAEEHYGVDVAAAESDAVKATLDGTVISAGWTLENGYVIQLQHTNNIVSVYKHNSVLLKKPGQFVKAGDPIAIVGTSGEQSTGPHLHFELWYNGIPLDPQDFISF